MGTRASRLELQQVACQLPAPVQEPRHIDVFVRLSDGGGDGSRGGGQPTEKNIVSVLVDPRSPGAPFPTHELAERVEGLGIGSVVLEAKGKARHRLELHARHRAPQPQECFMAR